MRAANCNGRALVVEFARDSGGVLREIGITSRNEVQVLAQNAFYFGANTTLQALAKLLEDGDVEQGHDVIERHGRRLKKLWELPPRARH